MNSIAYSVRVEVSEGEDILSIEKKVRAELQEAGKAIMGEILAMQEQGLDWHKGSCSCGSRRWEDRGMVRRKIVTLAGSVQYKRKRIRCRECGVERYPLDDKLKVPKQRNVTLGVVEQSLSLATEMPYEQASKSQAKISGIRVSGRQIQSWAKEEGGRIKERAAKEREKLYTTGEVPDNNGEKKSGRVFVQVDGTFVHERSGPGEVECKVGIIYSEKEKVGRNRWQIVDKRVYAASDGVEQFREQFVLECHRWGLWDAREIIFSGDGASWIQKMCKEHFPGAIYLLDYWHLTEQIRRSLGGEHETAAGNWIEEVRERSDPELLLRRIRDLERRVDSERQKKIQELYEYVKNNAEGIRNWGKVNILGSSGAIEKSVDVTVCRRFKRRGMSWLYPGLSGLLALKLLKLNGEWHSYWKSRGISL